MKFCVGMRWAQTHPCDPVQMRSPGLSLLVMLDIAEPLRPLSVFGQMGSGGKTELQVKKKRSMSLN